MSIRRNRAPPCSFPEALFPLFYEHSDKLFQCMNIRAASAALFGSGKLSILFGTLLCELKNDRFRLHYVEPGEQSVIVDLAASARRERLSEAQEMTPCTLNSNLLN
jgi:hypothetical protein